MGYSIHHYMVGQDEVTESLLNQLRGDAEKYQVMKLGQLVLSYKFIENVDQLEMTSGIKNTIFIPKDVGNSRAINSKLAIVDGDIISSKIHTQIDNERTRLEMMARTIETSRHLILEKGEKDISEKGEKGDEGNIGRYNLEHMLQDIQQKIRGLESGWIFASWS